MSPFWNGFVVLLFVCHRKRLYLYMLYVCSFHLINTPFIVITIIIIISIVMNVSTMCLYMSVDGFTCVQHDLMGSLLTGGIKGTCLWNLITHTACCRIPKVICINWCSKRDREKDKYWKRLPTQRTLSNISSQKREERRRLQFQNSSAKRK